MLEQRYWVGEIFSGFQQLKSLNLEVKVEWDFSYFDLVWPKTIHAAPFDDAIAGLSKVQNLTLLRVSKLYKVEGVLFERCWATWDQGNGFRAAFTMRDALRNARVTTDPSTLEVLEAVSKRNNDYRRSY
jgi:hypothetical protein